MSEIDLYTSIYRTMFLFRFSADNRKKARRDAQVRDFSFFNKTDELQEMNFPKMSPQLALATYQYLHTSELYC